MKTLHTPGSVYSLIFLGLLLSLLLPASGPGLYGALGCDRTPVAMPILCH